MMLFLVMVGDPGSPDVTFESDYESLEQAITQLVEDDGVDPGQISVWRRTKVEVKSKACSIHGLDKLIGHGPVGEVE
jgi:hypothetical protein